MNLEWTNGIPQKIKPFLKRRRSRYLLVILAFLVWIVFFDHNNLISQYKNRRTLRALENQKVYLETEIDRTKLRLENLNNPEELEKFAREEYLMRKENEDVFIIKEKE